MCSARIGCRDCCCLDLGIYWCGLDLGIHDDEWNGGLVGPCVIRGLPAHVLDNLSVPRKVGARGSEDSLGHDLVLRRIPGSDPRREGFLTRTQLRADGPAELDSMFHCGEIDRVEIPHLLVVEARWLRRGT